MLEWQKLEIHLKQIVELLSQYCKMEIGNVRPISCGFSAIFCAPQNSIQKHCRANWSRTRCDDKSLMERRFSQGHSEVSLVLAVCSGLRSVLGSFDVDSLSQVGVDWLATELLHTAAAVDWDVDLCRVCGVARPCSRPDTCQFVSSALASANAGTTDAAAAAGGEFQ